MKKRIFLALLLVLGTFCFAEKWIKGSVSDSWGEVTGSRWGTFVQRVNTSSKGKYCTGIVVIYSKANDGATEFEFCADFKYLAPYASSGYIEVKDGPRVKASVISVNTNTLSFSIPLTLEEYRRSYEGKLVQIQWGSGEYITIKAPVWEE